MAQVHLFLVCVNSTKEQTNDFLVAHLFIILTIFCILFPKFECCENKIEGLLTRSFSFLSLEEIFICEGCEFCPRWLQYNWTFSKKAHEFEFQPWKGQPTFLGNFILSLWIWVISIMQITFHGWKKVNNKLNYQQTTLV
jgi:hypothetical protein